ncbi:MAG: S46 family peptidase [Bacteroidia bacterium]|nr:S46 family peptidase [Bacteroidia bacterium]
MKKLLIGMLSIVVLTTNLRADEGMWLPWLLKSQTTEAMKKKGLKLTPDQLYDLNKSSLKDAIVWFGGGCTGEIVSPNGLVLTNHHCGYDYISKLSSSADNILDNGFWAKNYQEERPVAGLSVTFVVRVDDITKEVLDAVKGLNEKDRAEKLQQLYKTITDRVTAGTHYEAQCREMYKGNAYYVFTFERFNDVRLVGTPPQNIGKFGGETDNWMWPRHTGDFSMFRVYMSKDGKPAKYSADNIPLKAKHHLPINLKGIKSGDYAMIMGFPGRTNRYEFSQGVKIATDLVDPTIVALREIRLKAWKEEMNKDTDIRLKLSGNYASISNYWKYFRGEAEQLKNNKVFELKQKEEKAFGAWATSKPEYKNLLSDVAKAFGEYQPISLQSIYLNEGILAPTIMKYVQYASMLEDAKKDGDATKIESLKTRILTATGSLPYDEPIVKADKKIFKEILLLYNKNIAADQKAPYFKEVILGYGKTPEEAIANYTDFVFENSVFANEGMAKAFISAPRSSILNNDIAFKHFDAFRKHYNATYKDKVADYYEKTGALGRLYIKGLMEMQPNKEFYADANSSLRLTYGNVQSYMKYPLYTTLDEVIAKNIKYKDNPEFAISPRLLELYNKKDYGRYADKNGKLPTCFLSNNDITGGNSGSPVIDGEGRIIGLAFDGNWEAMSGNIHFDPKNKRTINVDIRYVLWLIEKYGEAGNIINEMTIVQ